MLNRRIFSAGLLLASHVRAQQAPKAIGVLFPLTSHEFEPTRDALVQALRDHGYLMGKHFVLVERFADGRADRLPELAADLAKLNVDLIYASSPNAVVAAQRATTKIPIVFDGVGDPVQAGFADSLAHPGRNITGLANISSDLNPKRIQFLKELMPKLTRLALLMNSANAFSMSFEPAMRAAAEPFGVRTQGFGAAKPQEFEPAFQSMTRWGAEAVAISSDAHLWFERQRIAQLSLQSKLPSMCPFAGFVDAGALMSYGVDRWFEYRKIAAYISDIFRGVKAGDLPIEQPTQIELVISRKTAKALELSIPNLLLLQADRVID